MNICSYFLAFLYISSILLVNTNAKTSRLDSLLKRHPEDKCGGTRMFYTPLIRKKDEEELGVCDSSCSSIQTTPGAQRRMHKKQIRKRSSETDSQQSTTSIWNKTSSSNLYTCDNTKTWPEEGIPENVKDNFPFNMRTCFYDQADTVEEELKAQKVFEQACKDANGVFVRPLHRTW